MPPAVESWNPNHWTSREVPGPLKFNVERKTLLKQGHNLDITEQCSGGEELWDRYLKVSMRISLGVWWLRLCASTAGGQPGSIPGLGTKILLCSPPPKKQA